MAKISRVRLLDGSEYDIGRSTGAEFVMGTWTSDSNIWTGVSQDIQLYDGKEIVLFLPHNGTSTPTTLNLTMGGGIGSVTGPKDVYFNATTRHTTHYGQHQMVRMVYHAALTIGETDYEGWWIDYSRDINYYDRERTGSSIKAETAITAGYLCGGTSAGYKHITAGGSFDISYPVLYSQNNVSADGVDPSFFQSANINCTLTNDNTAPNFTLYSAVYLKGSLQGSIFTVDPNTIFTQAVPTAVDGYVYYFLGIATSATSIKLMHEHKIFRYYNGAFQENSAYITNINTTVTVPTASWAASSGVYSQTVTVTGVKATMAVEPMLDIYHTAGITQATWESQKEAWNTFAESGWAITGANSITLNCYSAPAVDFVMSVQCWSV